MSGTTYGTGVTHDPLCPYMHTAHQRDHVACQCALIAKVREEKLDDLHAKSYREGSEDMLAKCIAAVVDMHQDGCGLYYGLINSCDCGIESALRALQEKP